MAKTSMAIPILLMRFSPMNFSRSGWLSKKDGFGSLDFGGEKSPVLTGRRMADRLSDITSGCRST
jgi:hypothetical protein